MNNIFTIPAAYGFAEALAAQLLVEAGDDPFGLADYEVFLPTRRAIRTFEAAVSDRAGGRSLILPKMHAVGDLDADEIALAGEGDLGLEALDLPPAMAPAQRLFLLAQLVDHAWERLLGVSKPKSTQQTLAYAKALASLLDTVETEGLDLSHIDQARPQDPNLATFWEQAMRFIALVQENWPAIEAETGRMSAAARRRKLIELRVADWQENPPTHPIILAGTTATIPAVAAMARAVINLPAGRLVLPGLDHHLEDAAWDLVAGSPTHPQAALATLLTKLGCHRAEVTVWPGCTQGQNFDRHWALSAAQRPVGAAGVLTDMPLDLDHLTLAEAKGPEQEARTLALFLRETLEDPEATAALITPDRDLAGRVAAELLRWNLVIDDSAGVPLVATPQGRLIQQSAGLLGQDLPTLGLASFLHHPLVNWGQGFATAREFARLADLRALRGLGDRVDLATLVQADPVQKYMDASDPCMTAFLEAFSGALSGTHLLEDWLNRHLQILNQVTRCESATQGFWVGQAGESASILFEDLRAQSHLLPPLTANDYVYLIEQFLSEATLRARYGTHPRLSILGTLEARLLNVDAVALGGLNEGTWPKESDVGPWLNRPSLAKIGLPSPERKVGLAAHDLAQAMGAKRVLMTRATRVEGTPTLPSRWIERLKALCTQTNQLEELAKTGSTLLGWAEQLDQPVQDRPATQIDSASACPPIKARPKLMWTTDVGLLVTNPYGFYAKRILGLRALPPRGPKPANLAWGILVHDVLERFVARTDQSLDVLLSMGQTRLEIEPLSPDQRALWQVQLEHCLRAFDALNLPYANLPSLTEAEGQFVVGDMSLKGKADRVVSRVGAHIIDYKTGEPAAPGKMSSGEDPQLPILALMALLGGFEGPKPAAATASFLKLPRRSHEQGQEKSMPPEMPEDVHGGLEILFSAYTDPTQPYLSAPFGDDKGAAKIEYDDYAHLARRRAP